MRHASESDCLIHQRATCNNCSFLHFWIGLDFQRSRCRVLCSYWSYIMPFLCWCYIMPFLGIHVAALPIKLSFDQSQRCQWRLQTFRTHFTMWYLVKLLGKTWFRADIQVIQNQSWLSSWQQNFNLCNLLVTSTGESYTQVLESETFFISSRRFCANHPWLRHQAFCQGQWTKHVSIFVLGKPSKVSLSFPYGEHALKSTFATHSHLKAGSWILDIDPQSSFQVPRCCGAIGKCLHLPLPCSVTQFLFEAVCRNSRNQVPLFSFRRLQYADRAARCGGESARLSRGGKSQKRGAPRHGTDPICREVCICSFQFGILESLKGTESLITSTMLILIV